MCVLIHMCVSTHIYIYIYIYIYICIHTNKRQDREGLRSQGHLVEGCNDDNDIVSVRKVCVSVCVYIYTYMHTYINTSGRRRIEITRTPRGRMQ